MTSKEINLAESVNPSTTLNKSSDKPIKKQEKSAYEKGFKIMQKSPSKKLPEKLID